MKRRRKRSKAEVNYVGHAVGELRCALCVMFVAGGQCTLVAGRINRNGYCDFFEAPPVS